MTDPRTAALLLGLEACIEQYIADRHNRVDGFVEKHFSLSETAAIQRQSLLGDLLCYPINALWAVPHLFMKKAIEVPEKLGWRIGADLNAYLPAGLKTRYQREIEWLITTELLEWPCRQGTRYSSHNAFESVLDTHATTAHILAAGGLSTKTLTSSTDVASIIEGHAGTRAFVSDSTATLLTIGVGWFFFGDQSLGISDMGERIASRMAREKAASSFFLGSGLGSAFYSVFPPKPSMWQVAGVTLAIGLTITFVSLLVGLFSDPCRKWAGLQRVQLHALIDCIDDALHRQLRKEIKPALLKQAA